MLKPKISFKTNEWTCKVCGLLIEKSKWKIKVGDYVFFNSYSFNKNFVRTVKNINGFVLSRKNNFLVIIEKTNNNTYFIDQAEVYLKESPALFLYNMYGKCACNKIE